MASTQPGEIVLSFIRRINRGDVDGLCALMTADHTFVDAGGYTLRGVEEMRKAWDGYFRLFPDYKISPEEILEKGDRVAVFGVAEATYAVEGKLPPENHWKIPAAWKAVVRGARVAEWRVYADNQPARKLMGEQVP
ncbi:MAG: nuclear transport factor 2 family protein [Terriglobia bacterium]